MPPVKKATAKPTAKKAAPKAAPKKAAPKAAPKKAAAKPAAKKTVAKPAAKKATTVKPKANTIEISVSGNKKVGTLQKEFNKAFPCLQLGMFYSYARQQFANKETAIQIDPDRTLASVARANANGTISIAGTQ